MRRRALPFLFSVMMTSFLAVASAVSPSPAASAPQKVSSRLADINQLTILDTPRNVDEFTFYDMDGRAFKPSDFRGKNILINFWATWCSPCVVEMPALDRLQKAAGNAFWVIPVALDARPEETVIPFYQKHEFQNLAVYSDTVQQSVQVLGLGGLPHTLIIGSDGLLHGYVKGTINWDDPEVLRRIREALGA